ncbi:hypothetical protein K490DRAFT_64273 [Saccharata proteae CBS 121410]|uniref:Uncharacterized protein n=1 Tax=Saccharata proteae CBS 121410 TaxID=1314787 RepID=A0A6A5YE23_9PEZI|nr:hypothetical protein K490DRAFT_64273 [Saccharata proteae CBS 121410]
MSYSTTTFTTCSASFVSNSEYDSDSSYGSSIDYEAAFDSTTTYDDDDDSNYDEDDEASISTTSTFVDTTTKPHRSTQVAFILPSESKSALPPTPTLSQLALDREEQLYRQTQLRRAARAHHFTRHIHAVLRLLDPGLAHLVYPSIDAIVTKGDVAIREAQNAGQKAAELKARIDALRRRSSNQSTASPDFKSKSASSIKDEATAAIAASKRTISDIGRIFRKSSSTTTTTTISSSSSPSTTSAANAQEARAEKKRRSQASKAEEKRKERELRAKQYDYMYGTTPSFADGFAA